MLIMELSPFWFAGSYKNDILLNKGVRFNHKRKQSLFFYWY